jgi:hypothetical protein
MAEYDSYLLRVWRSRRVGGWAWALRLEHLQDGERLQFDDPQALVEALWALVEPRAPTGPGPPETGGTEARPR